MSRTRNGLALDGRDKLSLIRLLRSVRASSARGDRPFWNANCVKDKRWPTCLRRRGRRVRSNNLLMATRRLIGLMVFISARFIFGNKNNTGYPHIEGRTRLVKIKLKSTRSALESSSASNIFRISSSPGAFNIFEVGTFKAFWSSIWVKGVSAM